MPTERTHAVIYRFTFILAITHKLPPGNPLIPPALQTPCGNPCAQLSVGDRGEGAVNAVLGEVMPKPDGMSTLISQDNPFHIGCIF